MNFKCTSSFWGVVCTSFVTDGQTDRQIDNGEVISISCCYSVPGVIHNTWKCMAFLWVCKQTFYWSWNFTEHKTSDVGPCYNTEKRTFNQISYKDKHCISFKTTYHLNQIFECHKYHNDDSKKYNCLINLELHYTCYYGSKKE
jgi:hypothetical protein